jgi:hypothetical protein
VDWKTLSATGEQFIRPPAGWNRIKRRGACKTSFVGSASAVFRRQNSEFRIGTLSRATCTIILTPDFLPITSSCREGSSSSSSSSSISEDEDEDEDEDERQPGFSFPVTPSFLRGEAARQAVF